MWKCVNACILKSGINYCQLCSEMNVKLLFVPLGVNFSSYGAFDLFPKKQSYARKHVLPPDGAQPFQNYSKILWHLDTKYSILLRYLDLYGE